MRKVFKHFAAVAAQVVNDAVTDCFFSGSEYRNIETGCFFNGMNAIIPVAEIYVFVNRAAPMPDSLL